jgi:hypothetical protein
MNVSEEYTAPIFRVEIDGIRKQQFSSSALCALVFCIITSHVTLSM